MIEKIKESAIKILGDNYSLDEITLKLLINRYLLIASNESNRKKDDEMLEPYVEESVIEAYLRRGKEGNTSSSEGGLSDSYIDIEEKLKKDIRAIRILP